MSCSSMCIFVNEPKAFFENLVFLDIFEIMTV